MFTDDYLSMGQFSNLSGIPISTLRYWDLMGLFVPAKRDANNNFRYYAPMQVVTARFISVMSTLGLSLQTIKELEADRSPEKVTALILQQEKLLDAEIHRLRECYSIIHTRLEMINYGMRVEDGFPVVDGIRVTGDTFREGQEVVDISKIALLQKDEAAYILGPHNDFKEGEDFYLSFMNFCKKADELRINLSFPIAGFHHDMASFAKTPGQPHHFISLDPTGNRVRESGKYLVGFCHNYYGQFDDLPERMFAYAKEHSLEPAGPVYTIYLQDEICTKDPNQYLLEVLVRVGK